MSDRAKLAIWGVGNLGSRYIQGLAHTPTPIDIFAFDPLKGSEAKMTNLFPPPSSTSHSLSFVKNESDIPSSLDVAVISTNSDVRFAIVRRLLETSHVKHLILEKVVFQRLSDYKIIEGLLKEKETKCWVNHPRRVLEFYKNLKMLLADQTPLYMSVMGGGWGLASNTLHLADLFSYISGSHNLDFNMSIEDTLLPDKRSSSFFEIEGVIKIKSELNHCVIGCMKDVVPAQISFFTPDYICHVKESEGLLEIQRRDNDWATEKKCENIIKYQSQITADIVQDLVSNDHCDLPTYSQVLPYHMSYIKTLGNRLFSDDFSDDTPVTIT